MRYGGFSILFDTIAVSGHTHADVVPSIPGREKRRQNSNAVQLRNIWHWFFWLLMVCVLRTTLPGAARQPLTFLVSPRKAKQKKATARSWPLRGSQRCAAENGRVANSLRSNMRPSYPFSTAHHWPGSKRIRPKLLAAHCAAGAVLLFGGDG